MYNIIKRVADGFAGLIVGLAISAVLMGPAAMALVFPGQYAPRYFPTQQTAYERHVINIAAGSTANTSNVQADTAQNVCLTPASTTSASCSIRIGALPYNAYVVRAYAQVVTACNTGGTGPACTMSLGTASGGAQLVSAASVASTGGSTALTVVAANAGIAATGNNIASTGADGGFDLYLTITQTATSMTEATAGTIVVVVEYFGANDGGCPTNVSFPTLANTVGPC